jgi:hypothetical protein
LLRISGILCRGTSVLALSAAASTRPIGTFIGARHFGHMTGTGRGGLGPGASIYMRFGAACGGVARTWLQIRVDLFGALSTGYTRAAHNDMGPDLRPYRCFWAQNWALRPTTQKPLPPWRGGRGCIGHARSDDSLALRGLDWRDVARTGARRRVIPACDGSTGLPRPDDFHQTNASESTKVTIQASLRDAGRLREDAGIRPLDLVQRSEDGVTSLLACAATLDLVRSSSPPAPARWALRAPLGYGRAEALRARPNRCTRGAAGEHGGRRPLRPRDRAPAITSCSVFPARTGPAPYRQCDVVARDARPVAGKVQSPAPACTVTGPSFFFQRLVRQAGDALL